MTAAYDRAPCGLLTTLEDGTIVEANATLLAWLGASPDEVVGTKRFAQLLSGGGRIYHETHFAPMLQMHGSIDEVALDLVRSDGTRLPALVSSVVDRDDTGAVVIRTAVFAASERRSYEQELLAERQRAEASEERSRQLAQTLQQTLIPPAPPVVDGLDIAAVYRPAGAGDEVGGDFYDVFEIGTDDWVVVVGDVCGKGVEAAVVTAAARHTIRGASVQLADPAQVMSVLNAVLLRSGHDRFCTLALLRLRRIDGAWTATVTSGGHPPTLMSRGGAAPVEIGLPGTLVGVLHDPEFHDVDVPLVAGDALVLYTDGVIEGRRGTSFYGEDRLEESIARHLGGDAPLASSILDDVMAFQDGVPRDDIVVVTVRVPG